MTTIALPEFVAGHPAERVDASLRQALAACDRARECAVLWFAEVQRRQLYRQLGHASLELYATGALGFSLNRYWQFKRLADDLDRLPALREAVASGQVGWTKAQQVARVATAANHAEWVALAATTSRRVLAKEVKAARKRVGAAADGGQLFLGAQADGMVAMGAAASGQPAQGTPTGGSLVPAQAPMDLPAAITLRADGLQLARFEALLEKARKLKLGPAGADRLDLVLAGLEALVAPGADHAGADGDASASTPTAGRRRAATPAAQIIVHQCPDCAAAAAVTNRGERRLVPAQVEALACDARVRKPGQPNRATIPPSVRAAVLARDRHRCAAHGCRSAHFLEVHHLTPRHQGGANRAENLITLCSRCHAFAHERNAGQLAPAQARGNAPRTG